MSKSKGTERERARNGAGRRLRDALRWTTAAEHSLRAALAHPGARKFWMEESCRQLEMAFQRSQKVWAEESYRQLTVAAALKGAR
jgi:hypothetical protein